ncbi:D-aspartate oxidase [Ctenopharyngodon idella]|uniref:D-aspartate oxidase n=1 Tax=Ctenopharyngodon idella TaxID=7959 RepID=UPI00222F9BDF|nr:D-aspartate oxidase [Ctenopharyngodon idella]XP_051725354.1 D-aspartate oxidase [Ctenopharyngodon idella]XP_051725355.1 D-aspartate oxidase [Ctenopharyngodon idella]XP_051725356.1 D-aspartate oxidase [Ctenopharyngodon idella]XP_051725357.1 D-aspartate oxidase [Ctenopharyngodon idella]
MQRVKVVVVGAGVVGLSTAVCIAQALPYCSVTVIAEKFSPDTTSDGAAGILLPTEFPDIPLERQKRWFKESFDHLLAIAYSPQAADAGVYLSSGYHIFKDVPCDKKPFWADLVFGFRNMSDQEVKLFPNHKFGQAFTTLKCECLSYLPWLEKRFRAVGGQILHEKVTDLYKLALNYDAIINCSGVGSRFLVKDEEVYPVRGQMLTVSAPWLKNFIRDGDGKTYIYPGIRYVTIGGTRQVGDWRMEVDKEDSEGILERCSRLEPSLRVAQVMGEWVGLRPGRANLRVEREYLHVRGRQVPLVHNYGHGGCGVTLAWGTALDSLDLLRQSLFDKPPQAKL